MTFSNLTVHDRRLAIAGVDMQVFRIARQYLYASALKFLRINEDTTTIVVALEITSHLVFDFIKGFLVNLDIGCFRTSFASILEPLKSQSSTDTGKEGQFSVTFNRHLRIVQFKLASRTAVVAASTEAKIRATRVHITADASVALTIKRAAVA
jgi:hypothetical protein